MDLMDFKIIKISASYSVCLVLGTRLKEMDKDYWLLKRVNDDAITNS